MKTRIPAAALGLVTLWAGAPPPAAADEKTGTSVSHEAVTSAKFSVHNPTADAITYFVKWGDGKWKPVEIEPGKTYVHSYRLNEKGEFPGPSLRFDYVLTDNRATYKVKTIRPNRVVRGGWGPGGNTGSPKAYYFEASADGRTLELYRK